MSRIITIGREFGSGGRKVGRRLAEKLNIAYYTEVNCHFAYLYMQAWTLR